MIFKAMFSSLILLCIASGLKAQTVYFDSSAKQSYCELIPVKMGFLKDQPKITRLYLNITASNLMTTATVHYWLMYEMFRPDQTSYLLPVGGAGDGYQTVPITNTGGIEQASLYLFNYVADSVLSIDLK